MAIRTNTNALTKYFPCFIQKNELHFLCYVAFIYISPMVTTPAAAKVSITQRPTALNIRVQAAIYTAKNVYKNTHRYHFYWNVLSQRLFDDSVWYFLRLLERARKKMNAKFNGHSYNRILSNLPMLRIFFFILLLSTTLFVSCSVCMKNMLDSKQEFSQTKKRILQQNIFRFIIWFQWKCLRATYILCVSVQIVGLQKYIYLSSAIFEIGKMANTEKI